MITPASALIRQFTTFAGVGAIGTAAHYATLLALVELVGLLPATGSASGFLVGALTNYALNYKVTFKSSAAHGQALPKFLSIAFAGFCINWGIMAVGTAWSPAHYLLVQVFSTAVLLLFNFTASRWWAFRDSGAK